MKEKATEGTPRGGVVLVADDYGLAPGVDRAIRSLIEGSKLSGTGCMTLFPEWAEEAGLLKDLRKSRDVAVGLHLTLTDFEPLSGRGPIGVGRMPNLKRLIRACYLGGIDRAGLEGELDAQVQAFVDAMGRFPDYIDGHQHVHFLGPVRRWLKKRLPGFAAGQSIPWLRGAPAAALATGVKLRAKVSFVAFLAHGFDREMARAGYDVKGPLAGFYDWGNPGAFPAYLRELAGRRREDMVVMCHPGKADDVLRRRDRLVAAREVEFAELSRFDGWTLAGGTPLKRATQ
ncbi:MAG: ChbG/HpnK family deacetylase [Allorhizobium sp.]